MSSARLSSHRTFRIPQLSSRLTALREQALHAQVEWRPPTFPQITADAWRDREPSEDWLMWRARNVGYRLRRMPLELSPGELIVGRPILRPPTPEEQAANEAAKSVLDEIPPFPLSDAGHFNPDWKKLLTLGIGGIVSEISRYRDKTTDEEKRIFYSACKESMLAFSDYIIRVADACADSPDHAWLAPMCRKLALEAPQTLHEAIQLMFFGTIALGIAEDHLLTIPGRMDQTLWPFYEADIAAGRITREDALELISCFYIQQNLIVPRSAGVSVIISGRDASGADLTNELSYLCLEARAQTHLAYPTIGIAWHKDTPSELMDFSWAMIASGIGDPAFFNDEVIVQGLQRHGVSAEDSYNWMNSACVEIKVVGASNIWVTCPYFCLPKTLLETMDDIADGTVPNPATFDELNSMVKARVADEVRAAAKIRDDRWRQRAISGCFPLASCLIQDCLERGLDFDRGGARYNWVENSFVGLANLADGLVALKRLVYESRELTIGQFRDILRADFVGHEDLRLRIINRLPSYGTDTDEADSIATEWAEFVQETSEANIVGGHPYVPGLFCWIMHGELGRQTGATPDGRKAGTAFADGAGGAQGRESAGPTASILSTTKWGHQRAIGGLVHNLKLSPKTVSTPSGLQALRSLIETYMRRGGLEIQINVVGQETLKDAQMHPERYADLIVRVAGYSDYFTNLTPEIQEEIIARTEH